MAIRRIPAAPLKRVAAPKVRRAKVAKQAEVDVVIAAVPITPVPIVRREPHKSWLARFWDWVKP